MSLEILEKFASESGNDEIVNAVKGVKDSYRSNLDRLQFLEKDMQKAVEKRDNLKVLVKNKLGLDELSEEALDRYISSKSSNDGEIKNLTSMIEALKNEKESVASKLSEVESGYRFEKALASVGALDETENSKAYEIVLSEIRKNAVFDSNGQITFKDNDGITVRNADGSPMTLSDRYNKLKESSDFSFLFKARRSKSGSGAGQSAQQHTPTKADFSGSREQRIQAIKSKFNI